MTTLPARESLHDELKRLIGEYEDDDAGDATKAEAWNLIADFVVENSKAVLSALAARSVPEAGKAVDETLEPPISRMSADDGAPEWQQIVKLFERHRHPQPETRFRDELTTILAWARYGEKAAGAVR